MKLTEGNQNLAEDLAQYALCQFYESRDVSDEPQEYFNWLCTVAKNEFIDRKRSASAETEASLDDLPGPREDRIDKRRFVLLKLIKELPGQQRRVLRMHYFQGLKLKEVAERLEISSSAARSHRKRGVEQLREQFPEKSGPTEDEKTRDRVDVEMG